MPSERAVFFDCRGDRLIGVLHASATPGTSLGVLIVVGGPQYRVGSHRQFVLMARDWASTGYPVMRFDYRGMGDSGGDRRAFDTIGEDIHAAVGAFLSEVPTLKGVVIFGLCDAASAALIYGTEDSRISGLLLANPWVRTPEGEARSYVRHYYGARLLQRSFWRKVLAGEFRLKESLRGFAASLSLAGRREASPTRITGGGTSYIDRMLAGLRGYSKPVLVLISEHDLTASEFTDLCADDSAWHSASCQRNVSFRTVRNADHTFASRAALDEALNVSREWLVDLANKNA